ncbi:MAG: NADH-quinone oxidoreductase subunit K [Planctomycetes bacterium]|nr:NADH-quinone oxidoreductase subunit K [Planctomycetota bacterium]
MNFLTSYIHYVGCFALVLIGLYVALVKSNLIKVIIGINLIDTGVNLFLVATGYLGGGTAPIFSKAAEQSQEMVDPVPQALVLTAIVIGVSVLALALALAIKVYDHNGTLDLRKLKGLKW